MYNATCLDNFTRDYIAEMQPQLQPQERIKQQSLLTEHYKIPRSLCIRVIHSDEQIVVIDKPCNLRSVPGHATTTSRTVDMEKEENDNDNHSTSTQTHPASRSESRKRPRQCEQVTKMDGKFSKMTAQEAWVEAIRLITQCEAGRELPDHLVDINAHGDRPSSRTNVNGTSGSLPLSIVDTFISQIANVEKNLTSVPRKDNIFERYWKRNHKRIISSKSINADSRKYKDNNMENLDDTAAAIFSRIEAVQQELLRNSGSVPEPTSLQESAWGQLILLGFGGTNVGPFENSHKHHLPRPGRDCSLYIVHRLDCETSGVMVFARTQEAASFLSQAWRERTVSSTTRYANLENDNKKSTVSESNCEASTAVSKKYLALVHSWPPWQQNGQAKGEIHLDLMPSEERLKWKVVTGNECGEHARLSKPSSTLWSVVTQNNFGENGDATSAPPALTSSIRLELIPLTGRTHQLRIHCATIGCGIVGDSLYGDSSKVIKTCAGGEIGHHTSLRLHAHKLSFLHPASRQRVQFETEPEW